MSQSNPMHHELKTAAEWFTSKAFAKFLNIATESGSFPDVLVTELIAVLEKSNAKSGSKLLTYAQWQELNNDALIAELLAHMHGPESIN